MSNVRKYIDETVRPKIRDRAVKTEGTAKGTLGDGLSRAFRDWVAAVVGSMYIACAKEGYDTSGHGGVKSSSGPWNYYTDFKMGTFGVSVHFMFHKADATVTVTVLLGHARREIMLYDDEQIDGCAIHVMRAVGDAYQEASPPDPIDDFNYVGSRHHY